MKEYAAARTALQSAISAGFVENDIDGLLAEAYFADNQAQQGLVVLKQAIDRRNTTPTKAPAGWYRRGLGVAYKSQLLDQAIAYSMGLVQAYPTNDNWAGAITVVREIGKFAPQESLDLMRLMGRTNSYAEERDYIEYIQAADARRLPGEVIKVLDAGIAAGKLRANDQFVAEARTIASGRVGPDRASLPALERDARAPGATAATLSGAADAFLSYGDLAKAEELYNLAMTKPGADVPRLLTRLGISQFDQGNYAAAQANFAKVTGPRQSIAQLWALYAGIKARPAA
jgi:tetratricopeptide (TPR) repeat protein